MRSRFVGLEPGNEIGLPTSPGVAATASIQMRRPPKPKPEIWSGLRGNNGAVPRIHERYA